MSSLPVPEVRTNLVGLPQPEVKSGLRSVKEIIENLSQRFPKVEKTRYQAGTRLTYLPWFIVNKILDKYAPGWSGQVVSIYMNPERIFVVYAITIPTSQGPITRSATGTEVFKELDKQGMPRDISFGDASSNAESMAFKRAAARFGLGLYLYEKD